MFDSETSRPISRQRKYASMLYNVLDLHEQHGNFFQISEIIKLYIPKHGMPTKFRIEFNIYIRRISQKTYVS